MDEILSNLGEFEVDLAYLLASIEAANASIAKSLQDMKETKRIDIKALHLRNISSSLEYIKQQNGKIDNLMRDGSFIQKDILREIEMTNNLGYVNRVKGSIYGLAVGDALGVTNEFKARGTFPMIADIVGGGVFNLKAGEWSDDTSMTLAVADSLDLDVEKMQEKQMHNFVAWYKHGQFSSNGRCFDIGNATRNALDNFIENGVIIQPHDANCGGNGSLMRSAPIALAFYMYSDYFRHIAMASRTTHNSLVCLRGLHRYSHIMNSILDGCDKTMIADRFHYTYVCDSESDAYHRIGKQNFKLTPYSEIKSSGYIVDTLEAAYWCFLNTYSFKDAIVLAANMGDDADTVAAVTGSMAGAYYGYNAIDKNFIESLAMKESIDNAICKILDFRLKVIEENKKEKNEL